MIKLISAISLNNVIGSNNKLPWNYQEDMKRFKELTTNSTVVMGAITFLHDLNSEPLKGRANIVLSSTLNNRDYPQVKICRSVEEVLELASDFWVIGGKAIYELFLPLVGMLEITHIHKAFIGDCYFNIDYSKWKLSNQQCQEELTFATYTRRKESSEVSSLVERLYLNSEANIAEISRKLGVYSFPSENEYKETGE